MKRLVPMKRLVMVLAGMGGLAFGVGLAHAQTPPAASRPSTAPAALMDERAYAEFTVGPTLGHRSSASFGAEGGYWLGDYVGVFAEGGHIQDIATTNIEAKALVIAGHLGATPTAKQPANYFDVGIAVRVLTSGRFTPYALFGIGAAKVTNKVTFDISGSDVTDRLPQFGVQLGSDLSGSYTKRFITIGIGTHIGLTGPLTADVSYRYGSIGKTEDLDSISTNRLQFGVGAKF